MRRRYDVLRVYIISHSLCLILHELSFSPVINLAFSFHETVYRDHSFTIDAYERDTASRLARENGVVSGAQKLNCARYSPITIAC